MVALKVLLQDLLLAVPGMTRGQPTMLRFTHRHQSQGESTSAELAGNPNRTRGPGIWLLLFVSSVVPRSFVMKSQSQDELVRMQEWLRKQGDAVGYRMKKLTTKRAEVMRKSTALMESVKEKYEQMKKVLEEDLWLTLKQLEIETRATVSTIEDRIERCYLLSQDLEQELSGLGPQTPPCDKITETQERVTEVLKLSDPDVIQLDEFKGEQLLCMSNNLLLFIRSQTPVTKKLFQSYAAEVILDPDTAHPKLIISPEGTCATYTDTWQEVPDNQVRFDTTLNVISRQGFRAGRQYWEVDVAGKTYWELGLTYPSIPRKGREEDCWLGRGAESWGLEYYNGTFTAWHGGVAHQLSVIRNFERVGVFCSFPAGLVSFLGVDGMVPLFAFCTGTFSDELHQAVCPGHDNRGTNRKPIRICSTSHHQKPAD